MTPNSMAPDPSQGKPYPEGFGTITDESGKEVFPDTAQAGYKQELNYAPPYSPQPKPVQVGQKKQILQRLMDNLLNKPGRSFHEVVDGIKTAIGAYKNYAKEWDSLSGAVGGAVVGGAIGGPAGAMTGNAIQKILQRIQQKKVPKNDGGGGPGMPSAMPSSTMSPAMPAGMPAGMPPAMPSDVPSSPSPAGGLPSAGQMPLSPEIIQQVVEKLQAEGIDPNDEQAVAGFLDQLRQTNPEIVDIVERAIAEIVSGGGESPTGIPPVAPQDELIAGAPASGVGGPGGNVSNNLGIWGY